MLQFIGAVSVYINILLRGLSPTTTHLNYYAEPPTTSLERSPSGSGVGLGDVAIIVLLQVSLPGDTKRVGGFLWPCWDILITQTQSQPQRPASFIDWGTLCES